MDPDNILYRKLQYYEVNIDEKSNWDYVDPLTEFDLLDDDQSKW